MRKLGILASAMVTLFSCVGASALTLEKIKFGDFSSWVTREITESKVIGGKTKTVYAIGPRPREDPPGRRATSTPKCRE